jgi:ribosomal protein S7
LRKEKARHRRYFRKLASLETSKKYKTNIIQKVKSQLSQLKKKSLSSKILYEQVNHILTKIKPENISAIR